MWNKQSLHILPNKPTQSLHIIRFSQQFDTQTMLLVNLAAAAVTAVLAVSSGRNMMQTVHVGRQENHAGVGSAFQPTDSTETVISQVQAMKRKELLELYFSSRGPKEMAEIEGEWDGCLLDNQSWIMVCAFEGRGPMWKSYFTLIRIPLFVLLLFSA